MVARAGVHFPRGIFPHSAYMKSNVEPEERTMASENETPQRPQGDPKYPEPIMQFFASAHLPERLQAVSKPFGELAQHIVTTLPRNAERSTALRKLLEGKDAAVRALLAE